jgi:hypothetical protein
MDGGALWPDRTVAAWESRPPAFGFEARFHPAGISLAVRSDDPQLLDELTLTLGADEAGANGAGPELAADIRTLGQPDGVGYLRLSGGPDTLHGPEDFRLGFTHADFPFRPLQSADPAWTLVAYRHEAAPLFWLNGERCLFRLGPRWRMEVSLFLFNRTLRARADLVFLHAAAVAIDGRGLLLVGPARAGKSTTALAVAARGHTLLSDDTACYRPASGELLPFRRTAGIKPGPRAAAVETALARVGHAVSTEGVVRLPVDALFPGGKPAAVPVAAVLFLGGVGVRPRLEPIVPAREHVAALQPFAVSLVNAPAGRRVLELTRLLTRAGLYRLELGTPDDTSACLEEVFGLR